MTFNLDSFESKSRQEDISFSEAQETLIAAAQSAGYRPNVVRMTADLYLLNSSQKMIDKLIESNQRVAESNEWYAQALTRATWALVGTTVALIGAVAMIGFLSLLRSWATFV